MVDQLAKLLKYLKYQKACDTAFGAFVISWIITRHMLYGMVVYSIYKDLPKHIAFGCYKGSNGDIEGPFPPPDSWEYLIAPFKDPTGLVCQTETMQNMFVGMLLFLQGILLVWFTMIVRVVMKVLSGQSADDVRSDEEQEEIEDQESEQEEQPLPATKELHSAEKYIEVLSEEPSAARPSSKASTPSSRSWRGPGHASGVSLPHDRKELLGRIGCDKGN